MGTDWIEKKYTDGQRRTALWGIDWPGHLRGKAVSPAEVSIQNEPERWRLAHLSDDPDADYSYDDLALMVRDDGLVALLETSGCSCPSPLETWGAVSEGTMQDAWTAAEKERRCWGPDAKFRGPWVDMAEYIRSALA